jgi:hypothetical protein
LESTLCVELRRHEANRNGGVRGLMTVSRSQARVQSARSGIESWSMSNEEKEKGGTTLFPTIKTNFLAVKGTENCF